MIEKLKEYFNSKEEVILAFLFGSVATKKQRNDSDIDIAIWLKDPDNMDIIDKIWFDLELMFNKPVELLRLNYASPTICWSALKEIPLVIKDYRLYFKLVINISSEAEDIQYFIFDLWKLHRKIIGERVNATVK